MVTLFGLRQPDGPPETLGHYFVGSLGDAAVQGIGVTMTHAFLARVRGTVEYSVARAQWTGQPPAGDRALLARTIPAALPLDTERVHDLVTSLEAEVPRTATRVMVFYRVNSAFIKADDVDATRGLDGRFEVQVNQSLPFLSFTRSQWRCSSPWEHVPRGALERVHVRRILVVRPPSASSAGSPSVSEPSRRPDGWIGASSGWMAADLQGHSAGELPLNQQVR